MARTALIVDDDKAIITLLAKMLSSRGFAVSPCADPGAALRLVREQLPDLVLLDVMMPGVDGIALCREITAVDWKPAPVVVVISAVAKSPTFRSEALRAGALELLPKPLTLAALDAVLARAFPKTPEPLPPPKRPESKTRLPVADDKQARNLSGGEARYSIGPRKPAGGK